MASPMSRIVGALSRFLPAAPTPPPAQAPRERRESMVRERLDGWMSALLGYGTGRDKRQYTSFVAPGTDWYENMELWRGDDLAGRIVEMIPNEMLRQGWELCVDDDEGGEAKDIQERVTGFLEDLSIDDHLWSGLCYERAFGGGAILMGTTDPQDFSQPLNLRRVSALTYLQTFEPRELQASRWQNDYERPRFGRPSHFRLNATSKGGAVKSYGQEIHESRLLIFPGIQVSRQQVTTQAGWGDAVLTRCRETLRDFQTCWAAAGLLAADFSHAVWKIKGLAEIIALDKDQEIHKRIEIMEMAKSAVRAAVIDADGEEFTRQQTPVSGLPELLDRFGTRLSAAADTPVTLLMGISPAGLNATGDSDIRTWYDRVRGQQNRKLRPVLERLIRAAFAALKISEPKNWYIEFRPLWQPTELEIAQLRQTQMGTDEKLIQNQMFTPEEIRRQRYGGRRYSLDTRATDLPEPDMSPEAVAGAPDAPTAHSAASVPGAPSQLNGAQIASLVAILEKVNAKLLSRDQAVGTISLAIGISEAQAKKLVGDPFTPPPEVAAAVIDQAAPIPTTEKALKPKDEADKGGGPPAAP